MNIGALRPRATVAVLTLTPIFMTRFAEANEDMPGVPGASSTAATSTAPQTTSTAPASPTTTTTATTSSPVAVAESWTQGYTLPDAPALTLLDVNSSKIQEPGTIEDLGADLLNAINSQGGIQSGLALKISGRAFGIGKDFVNYRDSYLTRLLARTSLSVATSQSSNQASLTTGALGLRLVFLDGTDPLTDKNYILRVKDADSKCPPLLPPTEANKKAHQDCLDALPKLTAPAWNANGLALAAATSESFTKGELVHGTWADTAVWFTGSLGIGDVAQASASAEYRHVNSTKDNIGAFSLRLRGGSSTIRGALEASYATNNPEDPRDRKGRLLAGFDVKLTSGTWLNANIGGDYNFSGTPFGVFSLASLKYAFASQPDIAK